MHSRSQKQEYAHTTRRRGTGVHNCDRESRDAAKAATTQLKTGDQEAGKIYEGEMVFFASFQKANFFYS